MSFFDISKTNERKITNRLILLLKEKTKNTDWLEKWLKFGRNFLNL